MTHQEPGDAGSALADLVERAHSVAPEQLLSVVRLAAVGLGALHVDMWLVDWQQELLTTVLAPDDPEPQRRVPVDGSTVGMAFIRSEPVRTQTDEGTLLLHLPMLDGIERLGVLQLELSEDDEDAVPACRRFSEMVTQYVSTKGRITDSYHRVRSRTPMSLAAQMQWQTLPPITAHAPGVVVAGQLEPAYEVGGDCFDYTLGTEHVHLAIFDAMGHGVQASLATSLAIAAYRNSRRADGSLHDARNAADEAIAGEFADSRFVTALFGDLELATGQVRLLNAGHLQPVLLRHHQVIDIPEVPPGLPLGLGGLLPGETARVAELKLQPGDRLVLVTDGILDATSTDGEPFGEQRLGELAERAAMDNLPLAELARAIARGVYDFQDGTLRDDASLLIVEYTGTAAAVPPASAPRPAP